MTWVVAGGRCPWQGLAGAATGLGRHEDDADELHGHGGRRNWTDSRAGRRLGDAGLEAQGRGELEQIRRVALLEGHRTKQDDAAAPWSLGELLLVPGKERGPP